MQIDVKRISGFLEAMAFLNNGVNHKSSYYAERVSYDGGEIKKALTTYYQDEVYTYRFEEEVHGNWDVEFHEQADGYSFLEQTAHQYFFELEFSPKLNPDNKHTSTKDIIEGFLAVINECLNYEDSTIYEVKASSSEVFYDIFYTDLLIKVDNELCLLHFGYSD